MPHIATLMANNVHRVHHKVHLGHERLLWQIAHLQRYSRINLVVSVLPAPDSPEKEFAVMDSSFLEWSMWVGAG